MQTIHAREFKNIGESLSVGQRTRREHSCGDGRTLIVSRNERGISCWCHRCHAKGWIPDERSLAERIQALSQAQEQDPRREPDRRGLWDPRLSRCHVRCPGEAHP